MPQSNAAARSRNSQQYTQRLSIQIEGGSRITGRFRRMCDSSFLWTCHWGGCSKIVRGYVYLTSSCCRWSRVLSFPPNFRTKETEGTRPVLSPPPVFVGRSILTTTRHGSQMDGSAWRQVPIESAGLLAGPTQTGVLEAQEE